MITIIDYQMGNVGSISNMIKKIGYDSIITSDPEKIKKATRIILPGVGAFDHGIYNLERLNLIEILNKKILEEKIPILGICLGMQLMTNFSEEGNKKGLGWINANTCKFNSVGNLFKIPHMGWNTVDIIKNSKLFNNMENWENRFYFVHSYYVNCKEEGDILTLTNYGGIDFASSFERENILGVQFHPEKSHRYGMELIKNFIEYF